MQNRQNVLCAIVFILFLSTIPISTNSINPSLLGIDKSHLSSVVWSDDFENVTKTLNEWSVDEIWLDGTEPITANVTISDGLLYSSSYPNTSGINILTHNSTTVTGTWSVDVFPGESSNDLVVIVFMSPDWPDEYLDPRQGYVFTIENAYSQYRLGYYQPDPAGALIIGLDSISVSMTPGWRHIDITRQPDDMMYVYIDGVLSLQGEDSRHHTSEYFRLWTYGSTIFDNITVSDTIDIDRAPPHWTEPLIDHTIDEGDDFNYTLHAGDYAGIDTWWVNDTANFVINQEGTLTSVDTLPAGTYDVEVFVNDTFGNVLSGIFNLEVISLHPTTTLPISTTTTSNTTSELNLYVLAMYGAAGVAWFVAVSFIFRDYRKKKIV